MPYQPEAARASESQPFLTPAYGYVVEHVADGARFFLTGWERAVSVANMPPTLGGGTSTFLPAQVRHSSMQQSAEFSKRTVDVTIATEDARLRAYFVTAAATKIRIFIVRFSTDLLLIDGEILNYERHAIMVNSGLIGVVAMAGQQITCALTPEAHLSNQAVPRFYFQRGCNHQLYGVGCGVNKTTRQHVTTIAAIDRATRTITLATNPSPAVNADYFRAGYFLHAETGLLFPINTTDLLGPSGALRLRLGIWNPALTPGDAITANPGCRHTVADCTAKFSNVANFGGFQSIPNRNPTIHGT